MKDVKAILRNLTVLFALCFFYVLFDLSYINQKNTHINNILQMSNNIKKNIKIVEYLQSDDCCKKLKTQTDTAISTASLNTHISLISTQLQNLENMVKKNKKTIKENNILSLSNKKDIANHTSQLIIINDKINKAHRSYVEHEEKYKLQYNKN